MNTEAQTDEIRQADLLVGRRCRVCGKEKPLEELVKRKNCKYGRDTFCKVCHAAAEKKWAGENKERKIQQRKANYIKNRDKNRKKAKENYKKYKGRDWHKKKYKRHNDKQRRELANNYVLKVITQGTDLKFNEIPKELIELKRAQISLYRAMYQ